MKHFYIESDNFWKIFLITFAILSLLPIKYFLAWLLCLIIVFILFRKNRAQHQDFVTSENVVCLSPVDGKVVKIEENSDGSIFKKVIFIKVNVFNPYGILSPFNSQVEGLEVKQKNPGTDLITTILSRGKVDCKITFKTKSDFLAMIRLEKIPIFGIPKLWIRTGDKTMAGACFGVIPYGGVVKLYLPENIAIAVDKGDAVVAGKSILAGIRGPND